jgi:hypothetical protein
MFLFMFLYSLISRNLHHILRWDQFRGAGITVCGVWCVTGLREPSADIKLSQHFQITRDNRCLLQLGELDRHPDLKVKHYKIMGNKKPGARARPSSDEFNFQSYDNNTNKKEGKPTLTKGSARHDIVY